ncbi:MAG: MurR/RpiR family transcriptional regulator [Hungatella hathewayi]|nr:MurR/RpiR family transcriptional regulator [Hungatella hathewayi]
MVSTVISKIISMQPNFTVSENAISQYVINHAEQILTTTITALADETGTSEASINRFCKKLGYKGFNGLKIALAQESFYNNMVQETPSSSGGNFISSITSDYRSMLNNTAALLDEKTVFGAAEMIKNARCINLYALANTTFAAREFRYKLELAGIRAKDFTDPLSISLQVTNTAPGDLSIFIARSIMMKDIYQAASASTDRGGKNLTITSVDSPKLGDLSDFKFIVSDKLIANNTTALSDNLMYLYVTDIIYSALLKSDKGLRQKKLNSDALINNSQTMDSYVFEY